QIDKAGKNEPADFIDDQANGRLPAFIRVSAANEVQQVLERQHSNRVGSLLDDHRAHEHVNDLLVANGRVPSQLRVSHRHEIAEVRPVELRQHWLQGRHHLVVMVWRMLNESQQVFVFRRVLRHSRQEFFKRAVDLRVAGDPGEERLFARKQHRLGDYVDDLPSERLERLRLASSGQQAGEPVRNLHAEHVVGKRVVRAGDARERKGKEYEVLFAPGPNGSIVSTVQDRQVSLGINEDDCLLPALNCLHQIELQVMRLAGASGAGHEHVAFEVAERNENWLFVLKAYRMKNPNSTKISWRSPLAVRGCAVAL